MSEAQYWILVCETYDALSDDERMKISFEDWCKTNNIKVIK